jgi:hypothetical protein
MPHHDPVPHRSQAHYERAAVAWDRYKLMMRRMVLLAVATALLSIAYLWATGAPMRLHMIIAVFAGVALTVLVGTGLMGLVFLSNRTGHDEDAAHGGQDDD